MCAGYIGAVGVFAGYTGTVYNTQELCVCVGYTGAVGVCA